MKFASLDEVVDIFSKWGTERYAESITQTEHGVQCARLAIENDAPAHLVLAALLHDIGHLVDLELHSGHENFAHDTVHEATGSRSISGIFPSSVRLPIALHVEANRWLCARQQGYMETLSPASLHSLGLQGGPMDDDEVSRFEALPGFADAVALRLWDDTGKNAEWGGSIADFAQILHEYSAELTK